MTTKHEHSRDHQHEHHEPPAPEQRGKILLIRPNTGISGDIMVAGLAAAAGLDQAGLDAMLIRLGLGDLAGRARLVPREVSGVIGRGLAVDLPEEHVHRHLKDVEEIFSRADMSPAAHDLAVKTFHLIAEVEAEAHGVSVEAVHFHEVGALDSIMDIGLSALLWDALDADELYCGPLPICDGAVRCQHGLLPSPAPAALKLLKGVPLRALASLGETVTPTGLALLKAMNARFGPWPDFVLEREALVYGSRVFEGVPNGALFMFGPKCSETIRSKGR